MNRPSLKYKRGVRGCTSTDLLDRNVREIDGYACCVTSIVERKLVHVLTQAKLEAECLNQGCWIHSWKSHLKCLDKLTWPTPPPAPRTAALKGHRKTVSIYIALETIHTDFNHSLEKSGISLWCLGDYIKKCLFGTVE